MPNIGLGGSQITGSGGRGGGSSTSNSSLAVTQTAHGFSVGQAIYFNGTTWALAEANAGNTLSIGIVGLVPDANDFTVYFSGYLTGLSGLTAGQFYYLSDSAAGALTTAEPTAITSYSNPILIALSTTTGVVLPYRPSQTGPAAATSTPVPMSIPDCVLYLPAGGVLKTNNTPLTRWVDSNTINVAAATNAGATYLTNQINGQPAISFPNTTAGRYSLQIGSTILAQATIFVVVKPLSVAVTQTIIAGPTGALNFRISNTHFEILSDFVASIAVDTVTLAAGTWYQANVTYNSSTGAFAFRVAQAAGSSGTNVKSISASTSAIGYDPQGGGVELDSEIAEIIVYNRVLTGTEITTIETYLNGKYLV